MGPWDRLAGAEAAGAPAAGAPAARAPAAGVPSAGVPSAGVPVAGVLAAAALIALLAGLFALSVRPFASGDESAHADYALTLVQERRLPTLFEMIDPVFPFQDVKPAHVANHPPLYYLLTGPVLVAGVASDHALGGYLLARGGSVVASMLTVVLVAAFAHALLGGRRPVVTVGAAALTATYPPLVVVSGVLHNDALAVMLSTATLWLVVLVVRRGPTPRLVGALAVTALAGTSVRAGNAAVVLVAVAGVLVAAVAHAPRGSPLRSALLRGVTAAVVVGTTTLVGIGWFFWRNQQLYGSALGYGVLEPQFGRVPLPTESLWLFRNPHLLLDQLGLPDSRALTTPAGWLLLLPALAVAAGTVLLLVRWWVHLRPRVPGVSWPGRTGVDERTVRRILLGLFLLHTVVTVVMVVRHVDSGGGARVRYLFPLLPIVATVAARALVELPGGRRGAYVLVAVGSGVLASLSAVADASWGWWEPTRAEGPVIPGIERGLRLMEVPWPGGVLAAALALLAVALLVVGLSCRRAVVVADRAEESRPVGRR